MEKIGENNVEAYNMVNNNQLISLFGNCDILQVTLESGKSSNAH